MHEAGPNHRSENRGGDDRDRDSQGHKQEEERRHGEAPRGKVGIKTGGFAREKQYHHNEVVVQHIGEHANQLAAHREAECRGEAAGRPHAQEGVARLENDQLGGGRDSSLPESRSQGRPRRSES